MFKYALLLCLLVFIAISRCEDDTEPDLTPRLPDDDNETVEDGTEKAAEETSFSQDKDNEDSDPIKETAPDTESEVDESSDDVPKAPTVQLKSGKLMPMLGLGTYRLGRAAYRITKEALEIGYRLIDTAKIYEAGRKKISEKEIGLAIKNSEVPRGEIFITTKIMPNYFSLSTMRDAVKDSLANLQTDYLDLLLLHYPDCGGDPSCKATGTYVEGFNNMAKLVDEGLVRDIGVSNFFTEEVEKLWIEGDKPVSLVQNWMDPYYQDRSSRQVSAMKGIVYQGYSTLGAGWLDDGMRKNPILRDNVINEIAAKCHATPAQVVLRWAISRRVPVIPGTTNSTRLRENWNSWKLEIAPEDLEKIDALDAKLKPLIAYGSTETTRSGLFGVVANIANMFKSFFGFGGSAGEL